MPLIVFIFLIDPLASYLGDLGEGGSPSLARQLGVEDAEVGPMWFVAALLAFSLAYALMRRLHPGPIEHRTVGLRVLLAAALLIAVTAFVAWRWWPLDDVDTFLNLRWGLWPQGRSCSLWVSERGRLEELGERAGRLGWAALAAVTLFAVFGGYEQLRGELESTLHGAGWSTLVTAVLYGTISVAFTVWFTALIQTGWSADGPILAGAGRASYATYFLHPLVLTTIMVLFASLALAPELKFLIVSVVAVPICFLVGYALTRLPGISKVL